MERKHWIDGLRGLCMLAILFDHTEVYYTGNNIIPYAFYVTNALTIFYFLSGYLFYHSEKEFDLSHKIKSIIQHLVVPYFIFTLLISFPKWLIHGREGNFLEIIQGIFMGQASWFIAALIIAEFIFSLIIYLSRKKLTIITVCCLATFSLSALLDNELKSVPWQFQNALQAILFLWGGYIYHVYEKNFDRINKTLLYGVSIPLLLVIKYIEYRWDMNMFINPVDIDNYIVFLTDTFLCAILFTTLFKYLPNSRILSWTGINSIVYYFLCGGVPLLISMGMNTINYGYEQHYERVIIAFIAVYFLASAITWLIMRYIPQITGRY